MSRNRVPLLMLPVLLLTSCGDGTGPGPVAVRLEIASLPLSLGVGERVQLEAMQVDAGGRVLGPAPQPVTWSSSDATVVEVETGGVARGLRLGSATLTVSSGSLHGSAAAEVLGPLAQHEQGAAASATIGAAGGSVTATAANGAIYTLTIPAGALQAEHAITLAPLASMKRFPGGAELVAGAHFAPEGLVLHRAATLAVQLPAGRSAEGLLAFAYSGDGEELHLTPFKGSGQTLSMSVTHFSGGGAVVPPTPLVPPVAGSPEAQAKQALALLLAAAAPALPAHEAMAAILRAWYTASVRPALVAAGASAGAEYATYLAAVREHGAWDDMLLILGVALEAERSEAHELHAPMLRTAIAYANERCAAEQALLRAGQALWLLERAELLELDTPANALDRATILQTLCVNAVLEHVLLLQEIEPGESAELSVLAGYGFGAGATRFDTPFFVQVAATSELGTTVFTGLTSAQGHYQTPVHWPPATTSLRIRVTVCMRSPYPTLHDLCTQKTLEQGAGEIAVRVTCRASTMFALAFAELTDGSGAPRVTEEDRKERELLPPGDCGPGDPISLETFSHTLSAEVELEWTSAAGVTTTGTASAEAGYAASVSGSAQGAPGLSVNVSGTMVTDATMDPYTAGRWALARGQVVTRHFVEFEVHGAPVTYSLNGTVGPGSCVQLAGIAWWDGSPVDVNRCNVAAAGSVQLSGVLQPGRYSIDARSNTAVVVCRGPGCGPPAVSPIPASQNFTMALTLARQP